MSTTSPVLKEPPLAASAIPAGGSGAMFDGIAERYDLLNRLISFGTDRSWRRKAVKALQLREGGLYLDLATGTADVALEILRQEKGARVLGIDPSVGMLGVGRQKIGAAGLNEAIELREGSAEELPLDNDSVDGITIAFGIRNVPNRLKALREMGRVTRPDGRIVILELNDPPGPIGALAKIHVHHIVPAVGGLLSGAQEYRYLERSIAAFPQPEEFRDLMMQAGLEVQEIKPLMFGAAMLFIAKPDPNPLSESFWAEEDKA